MVTAMETTDTWITPGDSLFGLLNENNNSGGGNTNEGIDTSGIELHNVFFDFDKATLRPESHSELNYWVDLLEEISSAQDRNRWAYRFRRHGTI